MFWSSRKLAGLPAAVAAVLAAMSGSFTLAGAEAAKQASLAEILAPAATCGIDVQASVGVVDGKLALEKFTNRYNPGLCPVEGNALKLIHNTGIPKDEYQCFMVPIADPILTKPSAVVVAEWRVKVLEGDFAKPGFCVVLGPARPSGRGCWETSIRFTPDTVIVYNEKLAAPSYRPGEFNTCRAAIDTRSGNLVLWINGKVALARRIDFLGRQRPQCFCTVGDGSGAVAGMALLEYFKYGAAKIEPPASKTPETGVLCLTFDDRNFDDWLNMLPLLKKYDAHVTFFVCGKIDGDAVKKLRPLSEAGHSIGSHGVKHIRAVDKNLSGKALDEFLRDYLRDETAPQIEALNKAGIPVTSFAYPMSARNNATDRALGTQFRHMRTGFWSRSDKPLQELDGPFVKAVDVAGTVTFSGICCDTNGKIPDETLVAMMERAAKNKELLVFYSHRVVPSPVKGNCTLVSRLEMILKKAQELGLKCCGYDELP